MMPKIIDMYIHTPILIGSRRYGYHSDDSDYNYLLIVAASNISDFLSSWSGVDIVEYTDTLGISSLLPVQHGYRIKGTKVSSPLVQGVNTPFDIIVVPRADNLSDEAFIMGNRAIYKLLYLSTMCTDQVHERVRYIRRWAKTNHVYGGAYPNGIGYLIYTINTYNKGYSLETSMKMIYQRALYFDPDYKYRHISHVSNKSFRYMRAICTDSLSKGTYLYQIHTQRIDDVLGLSKRLLDNSSTIMYIENSGIVHAMADSIGDIDVWSSWLREMDLEISVSDISMGNSIYSSGS